MSLLKDIPNPTNFRKKVLEKVEHLIDEGKWDEAYQILHPFVEWIENLKFILEESDEGEYPDGDRVFVRSTEWRGDKLMVRILKHTEMYN